MGGNVPCECACEGSTALTALLDGRPAAGARIQRGTMAGLTFYKVGVGVGVGVVSLLLALLGLATPRAAQLLAQRLSRADSAAWAALPVGRGKGSPICASTIDQVKMVVAAATAARGRTPECPPGKGWGGGPCGPPGTSNAGCGWGRELGRAAGGPTRAAGGPTQ